MIRGRPPQAEKVTRACVICGTEWEAYQWDINKLKFCSRSCYYKSRIGNVPANKIIEPERRPCKRCGREFLVGGEGRRKRSAMYCSKTCSRHAFWADGKTPHDSAREMSEIECAWFAGFFDGEGCIAWPRRHILKSVRLDVFNTNYKILEHTQKITGTGRIREKTRADLVRHSRIWVWSCMGDNARSVLKQVYQFLIIKKDAAEVALGIGSATVPPWTQRTRTMMRADEMKISCEEIK